MSDDGIFQLLALHQESATTAAGFSFIGLAIYSWYKKITYPQFLQAAAACIFLAVVSDITMLEWLKLPKVASVLIGSVCGFIGRPIILKYVNGGDDKLADKAMDRIGRVAEKE